MSEAVSHMMDERVPQAENEAISELPRHLSPGAVPETAGVGRPAGHPAGGGGDCRGVGGAGIAREGLADPRRESAGAARGAADRGVDELTATRRHPRGTEEQEAIAG